MIIDTKQVHAKLRVTDYLDEDGQYSLQLLPLGAYYSQLNREQVLALKAQLDLYLANPAHPENQ